jgi:hypothetical protein
VREAAWGWSGGGRGGSTRAHGRRHRFFCPAISLTMHALPSPSTLSDHTSLTCAQELAQQGPGGRGRRGGGHDVWACVFFLSSRRWQKHTRGPEEPAFVGVAGRRREQARAQRAWESVRHRRFLAPARISSQESNRSSRNETRVCAPKVPPTAHMRAAARASASSERVCTLPILPSLSEDQAWLPGCRPFSAFQFARAGLWRRVDSPALV